MRHSVKNYRKLFIFIFIFIISTISVFGQDQTAQLVKLGDIKPTRVDAKRSSILGMWDLSITVGSNPSAPPVHNRITFSGNKNSGTFVDKNNHSGTWKKLDGNNVTWTYTNVPNLITTYLGVVNEGWTEIQGKNSGTWQGVKFDNSWTGKVVRSESEKSEVDKWREDLQFIATELPAKHKNLFHRLNREVFYQAVKELDAKIPTLTKYQVALEFSRIVGLARDGHTQLPPLFTSVMEFHVFPINFYMFGDDIYVRKADPTYKDIVGGKVLKIGKMTTADAFQKVSPYISTDNEMGIKSQAPNYLTSPEVLQSLGISDSLEKVALEIEKGGRVFTKEISLLPNKDNSVRAVRNAMKDWVDANADAKNPTPLTLKKPNERFWFEYVKDKKLLYVQLNNVLNDENKTLAQFFDEVFEFAGKNELDKFVLDIRHNGGGNNTLLKPIIRGIIKLDKIDRPGHLFVIIGRQTFSAAQNLTNELENWTNVTFVGEPTASHVNLYGDARRFELPNSKMGIFISELWWQNKHARDERKWTGPHLFVEPNFADYQNNIDSAMRTIDEYKPLRPLREMAIEAVQKNQVKEFLATAKERLKNPLYRYQGSEDEINTFGYNLIQMKKLDDAIEVFKLNVELYPESFNVYDSLAESYMLRGNNELAIKLYKKSLELNPDNTNAVQMIEKMQVIEK